MKNYWKCFLGLTLFLGMFFTPVVIIYGQSSPTTPAPSQTPSQPVTPTPQTTSKISFPYWPSEKQPLISCTGDYTDYQGLNKGTKTCTSLCDVISTFQRILYFVMTLILAIGAPIMFVIGGGMIFFAGPNPSLLEQGRKVIWGAVIGVVLALSAYIIVGTFLWLIGNPSPGTKTVKGPDGKNVKVEVQRVSWPNIVCDPAKMPGGELKLWPGTAKDAVISTEDPNGPSSRCTYTSNEGSYPGLCMQGSNCGGTCTGANFCTKYSKPGCKN